MKFTFPNFKKADYYIAGGVLLVIIVAVLGFFGVNKFLYKTPVLEENDVYFSVFFRGVTITDLDSPFIVGEKTFITIRNVPYTKLDIVDVKFDPRRTLVQNKKGGYEPALDISQPCLYDFVVTVKDKAKITDDGAVVGGNKIKIGIPVILEGKNYKLSGIVSNVQIAAPAEEEQPVSDENGKK